MPLRSTTRAEDLAVAVQHFAIAADGPSDAEHEAAYEMSLCAAALLASVPVRLGDYYERSALRLRALLRVDNRPLRNTTLWSRTIHRDDTHTTEVR